MSLTKTEARTILHSMTETESLLLHAETVACVMEAYGKKFGEDPGLWFATGLLHDADYEKHPDKHPRVIVEILRNKQEEDMAHAISCHYTRWGIPNESLLDKALLACDELTGFIIACARVRPEGLNGLTSKSVRKKLKQQSFAAKVDRDEITVGINQLNMPLEEHIDFIIDALQQCKAIPEELRG